MTARFSRGPHAAQISSAVPSPSLEAVPCSRSHSKRRQGQGHLGSSPQMTPELGLGLGGGAGLSRNSVRPGALSGQRPGTQLSEGSRSGRKGLGRDFFGGGCHGNQAGTKKLITRGWGSHVADM